MNKIYTEVLLKNTSLQRNSCTWKSSPILQQTLHLQVRIHIRMILILFFPLYFYNFRLGSTVGKIFWQPLTHSSMHCIEHIDKGILTAQYPDGRSVGKKAKRQQQQNVKIHSPTLWIITETTIYWGISSLATHLWNFTFIFAILQDVNLKSEWIANTFEVVYSLLFIKNSQKCGECLLFWCLSASVINNSKLLCPVKVWRLAQKEFKWLGLKYKRCLFLQDCPHEILLI